jgi:diguanylate cyclase (GGDEF)-like protein
LRPEGIEVDGDVISQVAGVKTGRSLSAWAGWWRAAGRDFAGTPRRHAQRLFSASRLIVVLTVIAIAAIFGCAIIGYGLARHSDAQLLSEQHAALRNAVAEFRGLFGMPGAIDPRLVRMIEQSARLDGLRFETEPAPGNREMQPVLDARGRIAGFFTWNEARPMMMAMYRLLPLIGGIAIVLVGFAAFSLRQLRRARCDLAASEELARRAADVDKLTGLPNHARTLELLDIALAERADDEVTNFALLELDGMGDVNAQLGVLGGDAFIVSVAERLTEALPAGAICGRVGSDKFAVILSAAPKTDMRSVICAAIEAAAHPLWIDWPVRESAHAGFAQAPRHAVTRGELTRRAELALRAAAKKGPGAIVAFERALEAISSDQKFIQRELPRALDAGELELHYQPIVAAQGARVVGVEALLRWNPAERGAIGPAVFIPVAERMGLMEKLGGFVLRRALTDAKRWSDLYVAVNLSPVQVRDASVVDLVRSALAESGVAPSRLMLEITEGVLIDNPDEMLKRIEDLHALGVRVALDDFGSGYSSLGYLQRFPLDKLKIDQSFVAALGASANGGVFIQAIVALGRALGLSVLAEGVETEQQRVLLRLAGCDEMQGFLFARPGPPGVIDRLLRTGEGSNLRASSVA